MANKHNKDYDVVYFVKECVEDEELRYSLRSIEKNFPHSKVWFFGCAPTGIQPDKLVRIVQAGGVKYDNVKSMLRMALATEEISEDFWLFNDDFFVMKPVKDYQLRYNGSLYRHIVLIENQLDRIHISRYTQILRRTAATLEQEGFDTKNYETHVPMLINRKKAIEIFEQFGQSGRAFRSLYGNYYNVGGVDMPDVKNASTLKPFDKDSVLLSTTEQTFDAGEIGEFIRSKFPKKSRFEK